MPSITVKPNVALTPYAESNLVGLRFDPQEAVPLLETTIQTHRLNWFSKAVRKVDISTPYLGIVLIRIALAVSLIGIPVIVFARKERKLYEIDDNAVERALNNLNVTVHQENRRAQIIQNLGIPDFENLPTLNLQGRMGSTDYIDFLQVEELPYPVMKGIDRFGRPFLSLKVTDSQTSTPFVAVLFQRYTDSEAWVWVSSNRRLYDLIPSAVISENDERIFREIIQRSHTRFNLA